MRELRSPDHDIWFFELGMKQLRGRMASDIEAARWQKLGNTPRVSGENG